MLQRRSWPPTAEPRAALLMLDESSAGAEVGVIWDATWARLEQCNTCFEKSGRLPVHLGGWTTPSTQNQALRVVRENRINPIK